MSGIRYKGLVIYIMDTKEIFDLKIDKNRTQSKVSYDSSVWIPYDLIPQKLV